MKAEDVVQFERLLDESNEAQAEIRTAQALIHQAYRAKEQANARAGRAREQVEEFLHQQSLLRRQANGEDVMFELAFGGLAAISSPGAET